MNEGFALWYLHFKPQFPEDFSNVFGYKVYIDYLSEDDDVEYSEWVRTVCLQGER
jgi:hypothetical protein